MNFKVSTFLFLFVLLLAPWSVEAQNYERLSEYEQNLYGSSAYVNGDYETMKTIRSYWQKETTKLKNRNYEFVLCGNAEGVLKVTIPSRLLYAQSDTLLSVQADAVLRPLLHLIKNGEPLATCIVSCHSDNNGSDKYLNNLTKARASSIFHWMIKQGIPATALQYHGLGKRVNRVDNETIRNREMNRRVTIYFVPNKKMLKLAKKGKLG